MVAPLKIGIAGLGTVGTSVVHQIEQQREALAACCGRPIVVAAVCARSRGKKRPVDVRKIRWVADPVALASDRDIDVFVELMGGEGDPARAAISAALAAKKSVVTANKALLARHGVTLAAAAERNRVALNFEAAVGGAIPIVKTLREGLAGNSLDRIYGILNGTCNYILTRMEQEKLSFAQCLKEAQRLGYAEADPSFDVEGHDTAQKLAILASLAFGTRVDESAVYVEGISSIAPEDLTMGRRARLSRKIARRRGQDHQGHRAKSTPDHGPEGLSDRASDGGHQRGHCRCRCHLADHAGRPRRRRSGHRICRRLRHRRHCPRGTHSAVRPADRATQRQQEGSDAAARGRLLHPAAGGRQTRNRGDHRSAPGATEHLARIDRAAPSWRAAARRRYSGIVYRAGAGDSRLLMPRRRTPSASRSRQWVAIGSSRGRPRSSESRKTDTIRRSIVRGTMAERDNEIRGQPAGLLNPRRACKPGMSR